MIVLGKKQGEIKYTKRKWLDRIKKLRKLFDPFDIQGICLVIIVLGVLVQIIGKPRSDHWLSALLLGVIASAGVAFFIEMGNNRRRSERRKRLFFDLYMSLASYIEEKTRDKHDLSNNIRNGRLPTTEEMKMIQEGKLFSSAHELINRGPYAWRAVDEEEESDGIELSAIASNVPRFRKTIEKAFNEYNELLSLKEYDLLRDAIWAFDRIENELAAEYRYHHSKDENVYEDSLRYAKEYFQVWIMTPTRIGPPFI